MIIIPSSKPSQLDLADYINYIIRAIGIGLISAICTIIIPIWLLVFFGPKPARNKKAFDQMLNSDAFTSTIEFATTNIWSILLISALIFSIRYLVLKLTRERVVKIILDNQHVEFTIQKAFSKTAIKKMNLSTIKIIKYELSNSGFIGDRLIMCFSSGSIKVSINTNNEPWDCKDIEALKKLKNRITEFNPKATPTYNIY